MRVLVVNPPNQPFTEKSILIEPIDALSIASYAQFLGSEVELVDMDVKQMLPESIEEKIKAFQPEITFIPFDYHIPLHTSDAINGINKISSVAKNHGSRVVIGGKTAKAYPEAFTENGAVVVNGEIELVMRELLDNTDLSKIKGITYKNRKLNCNPPADKISLDSLPIPDRSLVDLNDYVDVRTVWTSRGCTGKCGFCATPEYWGSWRARSPEKVVNEIEQLANNGAKKILFLDDNATASRKRTQNICKEILKRDIKAFFGCLGRISEYDKETVDLMYKAGFRWIHYGAESGSQKVLDLQGKGITVDQIRNAVKGTKDAGLRVRTSWIFDLPGLDEKGMQDTIDLILDTEPDEIRAHYLVNRAGTAQQSENLDSQYIHHDKPLSGSDVAYVKDLTQLLEKRGYLVIRDPKEWRDLDKLREKNPDLKFVSFCPSRYGLNWEK